jgi:uncharacterized repeat protein (TIGR01451 family)
MPDLVNTAATSQTGTLVWQDLTAFYGDLAPGAGISVRVAMTATGVTPPGVRAQNRATVLNAVDEYSQIPPEGGDEDVVSVVVLPNIAVTKVLDVPNPVTLGDEITFTIRITNTGRTTIVTLPLSDTYDAGYLGYIRSVPAHDRAQVGMVEWNDLTTTFGDLAPAQGIEVKVIFTTTAVTTQTVNYADVFNAIDNFNNRVGAGSLAPVVVQEPTLVELLSFQAVPENESALRIEWVTGSEINSWGFHLWRSASGSRSDAERITNELVVATGGPTFGARYSVVDRTVQLGVRYTYWLQETELDGSIHEYGPIRGGVGLGGGDIPAGSLQIFLPMVGKGAGTSQQAPPAPHEVNDEVEGSQQLYLPALSGGGSVISQNEDSSPSAQVDTQEIVAEESVPPVEEE